MSELNDELPPGAKPGPPKTPGIKKSEGYRILTDIMKRQGGFGAITSSGFD